jgi:hypothetical protein
MTTATATYLEPAEVTASKSNNGRIEVRLRSGERAWARPALAIPHQLGPGDEVLVIGNDLDELYIIGVLRGSGLTRLILPGDLAIEAPQGSISFSSAKRVAMKSGTAVEATAPKVVLRADRLDFFAKRTIQRFGNAYTWVSELFQLKTKRTRSVADEGYLVKAGRAHIRTEQNCVIQAKTIHLG